MGSPGRLAEELLEGGVRVGEFIHGAYGMIGEALEV